MGYLRRLPLAAASMALAIATGASAQALKMPGDSNLSRGVAPRSHRVPVIVEPGTRSQAQDNERARGLIRIGEEAIARENDAALDAYFASNFVFHGPGGDMNYAQLKANFAAMRAAFSDFTVARRSIIVRGDYVAARTTMTGTFTAPFDVAPYGTLAPTGKPIRFELTNIFRYDAEGKLAEEWVQSDNLGFLRQLGLVLEPVR